MILKFVLVILKVHVVVVSLLTVYLEPFILGFVLSQWIVSKVIVDVLFRDTRCCCVAYHNTTLLFVCYQDTEIVVDVVSRQLPVNGTSI